MYAVIRAGGKQYRVSPGDVIRVETQDDKDGKVHLRPISIGRDFVATLEILGGLDVSDQIVINPSDSLEEGQQVHVAKPSAGDAHS